MATKMRLARGGSKKRPFYRIVIADERAPRDGNFIEKIGNFNPMVPKDHKERVVISKERAEHWPVFSTLFAYYHSFFMIFWDHRIEVSNLLNKVTVTWCSFVCDYYSVERSLFGTSPC